MCGSRNFHQVRVVEGPGPPDIKKLGQRCFVVNNNFPMFKRGFDFFFGGGGGCPNAYFRRNLSKL